MAGSNANAANYPDGQAVWESVQSLNAVSSGHCNMVYHAAGWLEAGLTASFEKVIMDCEVIQQQIYLNQPLDASEDALAFEAMKEVGPGSHFFAADHTQRRFKDAFYSPFLSDWRNFETWEEAGGLRIEQKANAVLKSILAEYTPPPLRIDSRRAGRVHGKTPRRGRGTNRFLGFIGENIPWQKKCRIRPESSLLVVAWLVRRSSFT